MAFSHILCFCATLVVFGVSSTWGADKCTPAVQKCSAPLASMGDMSNMKDLDMAPLCKKFKVAEDCIKKVTDCSKSVRENSMKAYKAVDAMCKSTGKDGDMGVCKPNDLEKCSAIPKNEKEACSSKKVKSASACVDKFEKKCKSKFIVNLLKQAKKMMDSHVRECKKKGYNMDDAGENIKPSYILILAAAILLAIRVHF